MSISQYKSSTYSQFGEDGLLQEIIKRIKPSLLYAVEFGGWDGYYCSNTALLREQGWQVNMYDIEPRSPLVMKLEITPENINSAVRPCTVLSMDTDGPDYELWKAYTGKPDVVIIEINSGKDPYQDHYDRATGANYSIMKKLGEEKGYFLLCHTGNMIFVLNKHKKLFPDRDETFIGNV